MTKEERIEKIKKAKKMAFEIKEIFNNIVWEKQEGQVEHFDKLSKAEQIALIGCFNDAVKLDADIKSYLHWFGE